MHNLHIVSMVLVVYCALYFTASVPSDLTFFTEREDRSIFWSPATAMVTWKTRLVLLPRCAWLYCQLKMPDAEAKILLIQTYDYRWSGVRIGAS